MNACIVCNSFKKHSSTNAFKKSKYKWSKIIDCQWFRIVFVDMLLFNATFKSVHRRILILHCPNKCSSTNRLSAISKSVHRWILLSHRQGKGHCRGSQKSVRRHHIIIPQSVNVMIDERFFSKLKICSSFSDPCTKTAYEVIREEEMHIESHRFVYVGMMIPTLIGLSHFWPSLCKNERKWNPTGYNVEGASPIWIDLKATQFDNHETDYLISQYTFLTNMGGGLGLFLGFSVVTALTALYDTIYKLAKWAAKKRKQTPNIQPTKKIIPSSLKV